MKLVDVILGLNTGIQQVTKELDVVNNHLIEFNKGLEKDLDAKLAENGMTREDLNRLLGHRAF